MNGWVYFRMILGAKKDLFLEERGQNLTEVALIIGIVGLVLIGMQTYFTRGIQGKLKGLTDKMIGTEQSVYQQDVSGYEVNTSNSQSIQDSVATLRQSAGGGISSVAKEDIFTTSESETED